LHPPLHVDERELHVDGRAELGLRRLQLLQLDYLTRFGPGRARWTLRLLSDQMVVLEQVESVSFETVRRVLKKTNLSLG